MTESTRGGSKSSGSFQNEWHDAPGVVHVRAKKRSELVLLLPDAGGECARDPSAGRHHLGGGGGVDVVSDERWRHPPGGPRLHLIAAGACAGDLNWRKRRAILYYSAGLRLVDPAPGPASQHPVIII